MEVTLEFGGGAELLFGKQKEHQVGLTKNSVLGHMSKSVIPCVMISCVIISKGFFI